MFHFFYKDNIEQVSWVGYPLKGWETAEAALYELEGEMGSDNPDNFCYELREVTAEDIKGRKGGNCNVTACQKPGAYHFNKSTLKYYCANCAHSINWPGGRADCMELFGTPLLCELDKEDGENNYAP